MVTVLGLVRPTMPGITSRVQTCLGGSCRCRRGEPIRPQVPGEATCPHVRPAGQLSSQNESPYQTLR